MVDLGKLDELWSMHSAQFVGGVGGLGLVHILDKCVNYYYGTKSAVRIIPILFFSIFDGHTLLEY